MDISTAKLLALRLFDARRDELGIRPGKELTKELASGFESRTRMKIPADLREWLTLCNGARIEKMLWTREFLGIARKSKPSMDIEGSLHEAEWRTLGWFPIAGDGCGQMFMLVPSKRLRRHVVCFKEGISEPDELEYIVATSLWHFLAGVLSSRPVSEASADEDGDDWPYDRASALLLDPDLKKIAAEFSVPWS